jgi:type III restriction enzyme
MNKIDFQTRMQKELVERAMTLLGRSGRSAVTLKAPTGSGKTVMMANALADLSKACEGNLRLVILWVAPNKLHEQSYERLKQVYGNSKALACVSADELTGTELPDRAVVFMNWSSIDSEKLVLRRDNETGRNLESYVQKARLAGRKVVLVVDESHLHLDSGAQAQVVVDHIIKPDLLIEVSATPRTEHLDATVEVLREDVIAAGLIRKGITVNPGADVARKGDAFVPTYDGTSEGLLDAALTLQAELTRKYKKAGSPVVPLVLLQLPDRRADADAQARFERYLLMKHGIERGNGLAVWLSGDRSPEIDAIAEFGSPVRIMLFKQAAATGWDCPRAQILVGLKEMQSETFTTQVLGRIIRQPERRHYADDDLNRGYVFTNYPKLEMDAETATWLSKALVKAKEPLVLELPNWVARHQDRRSFLTLDAVACMLDHQDRLEGVKHQGEVLAWMIDDVVIDDIDARRHWEGTRSVALDISGLQQKLDQLKRELVSATASQSKGKKYIDKALRNTAEAILGVDDDKLVLETILHPLNKQQFIDMVEQGIADFLQKQAKVGRVFEERSSWTAPETRFIELSDPLEGYAKCLYAPVLAGQFQKSDVEEPFSRLLDTDPNVQLWLKNGDNGQEHFAIPYELNEDIRLFYPDFIVKTVTGGIRLYDTKGASASEHSTGNTTDTHAKARALNSYITALRNTGIDVAGGIVVRKAGVWWAHDGENYPGTTEVSPATGWRPFSS